MKPSHTVTISSREIAELTGKHHAHVMDSIRRTFAELDIQDTGLTTYIDRQGKPRPCYHLTADRAVITFPSRCVKLMAALLERLEELQAAAEAPEPSAFADEFAAALDALHKRFPFCAACVAEDVGVTAEQFMEAADVLTKKAIKKAKQALKKARKEASQ